MATPKNRAAYITSLKARPLEVSEAPMPTPLNDEVVIKVKAIAINPCDWAIQTLGIIIPPEKYPFVNGCDVAGVVDAVGPENTRFKVGDRVTAGCLVAFRHDNKYGAFQEYVVGAEPLVAKIPDGVSFAEGAVLPLTLCTALWSLFLEETMALELPGEKKKKNGKVVLVWGGASSVGCCAVQAAKAAGYAVGVTASPKNFALMQEIGADWVFDYNAEGVADLIVRELGATGLPLAGVFDAIIAPPTVSTCADIASRLGAKKVGTVLVSPMPFPADVPADVELSYSASFGLADTAVGKRLWAEWLPAALADGSMKCKPNPEVIGRGLEKLQEALDTIGKGVNAKKIVVEL
ncbi:zinc-binding oxidoreductase CipB [Xylariales sp. PMI_506]|nr:zinc-binding oxidoreductase CipB [Xylariales sp. PMI_506]